MIQKAASRVSQRLATLPLRIVLRVATGGMFIAVGLAAVLLTRGHMRDQALAEAESKARILLERNLATHTYFSHQLKPHLFAWSDPFRDEEYFDPTWMSSTYAVREIDKYFQSLNPADYYYKEAAVDARSPENEADAYEAQFLQELNADPGLTERALVRTLDGQPYFVTFRRGEEMEESCLRCHSTPAAAPEGLLAEYGSERSFSRQPGDVISAISIRVPLAEAYGDADLFAGQLSVVLLAILIGLFAAQVWLYDTFVFAPIGAVRSRALQIAAGTRRLGEQIPLPRGKELQELTLAFNHMSRSLQSSYDHLEQRVEERTADLARSNERLEREIEERKKAEEALRESEIRFHQLFDRMGDGVAIYRPADGGQDFILQDINRAGERISRVSREEVVGRSVRQVFPGVEVLGLFEVLEDVHRTGRPRHHPLAQYQDDRVSLWVENYVYKLPSGEIVAVYDDVTERRRMAEDLRASEQRYHELVENQGEGIGIVDTDENFVFANPAAAEIFGVAPGDLEGRSMKDFVAPEVYAAIREQTGLRRSGRESSYEIEVTWSDGERRTLLITATPRYDETGDFIGTFAVFRDITERRRLEQLLEAYAGRLEEMVEERTQKLRSAQDQLLRSQKLAWLGQLAGSINHELRGPLGNIKSGAYVLDMVLENPDDDVKEIIKLLEEEVERAESIVTSLLSFVRTQEPQRQPVDVNGVVEEVLTRTQVPQEITVVTELGQELPTISADPDHLRRVFRNLISNAVEAMPGEGRLAIRTAQIPGGRSAGAGSVLVSVTDSGCGIPAAEREKVFEPLFSTKAEGVGLGLALAQMLVAAHGGAIELESEVGKGSTFTVRLPLEEEYGRAES